MSDAPATRLDPDAQFPSVEWYAQWLHDVGGIAQEAGEALTAALAAERARADQAERERDAAQEVYATDVAGWRDKAAQEMYRADTVAPTAWFEGWHAGWLNRHQATPDRNGAVAATLPIVNPYEKSAAPTVELDADREPALTRDQFTNDYSYWLSTGRWASDELVHARPPAE